MTIRELCRSIKINSLFLFLPFFFSLFSKCMVDEDLVDMSYSANTSQYDTLYYAAYDCTMNINGCDSDSMTVAAKVRVDNNDNNSNVNFIMNEKNTRAGELKLLSGKKSVDQLPIEKEVSITCRKTLDLNISVVGSLNISGMNSFQKISSTQLVHLYDNFDYNIETTKGCSLFVFGYANELRDCPKRVRVNLTRPSPDFRGICICNPGRASGASNPYNKDLPACSAFVEIPKEFPASICAITTKGNVFFNGTSVGREYRSSINGANENQNPIYVRAVFYIAIKERQDSL